MPLIELFLETGFILFLLRVLIKDTGQMSFNQPFRFVVRLTQPTLDFLGRWRFLRGSGGPGFALLLIILLQGFLYAGGGGEERFLTIGLRRWEFRTDSLLWGPAKSVGLYLILCYRVSAFLLIISILPAPAWSADQLSRFIRQGIAPLEKISRRGRLVGPLMLLLIFSFLLAGTWRIYAGLGWLELEPRIVVQSFLCGIGLLLGLTSVFIALILIRTVLSWIALTGGTGRTHHWLAAFTDPLLKPFERLNLRAGGWDFTPVVAIFCLVAARHILLAVLTGIYRAVIVT